MEGGSAFWAAAPSFHEFQCFHPSLTWHSAFPKEDVSQLQGQSDRDEPQDQVHFTDRHRPGRRPPVQILRQQMVRQHFCLPGFP